MNQFNKYSHYYDHLYQTKDYNGEVKFIRKVINKYSEFDSKSILSLGCGTCNHDILLAQKGYSITGVDLSPTMLEIAKEKIKQNNLTESINLIHSDVRNMDIQTEHDLAMAMFNVIGYQITNKDINDTLKAVNKGLKRGGLFFFDCWYLPAVLADKPTDRVKQIENKFSRVIRLTRSKLNMEKCIIDINFHVLKIEKKIIVDEVDETHSIRFWTLPELKHILNSNGFKLEKVSNFMDLETLPSEKVWDIFVVARKI